MLASIHPRQIIAVVGLVVTVILFLTTRLDPFHTFLFVLAFVALLLP